MRDPILTDEMKQMNAYWRLLVGLVNEGLGIVNNEPRSPEVRLEQLRERLAFAQRFTRELPSSVRVKLGAKPAVEAALARIRQRIDAPQTEDTATALVVGENGVFTEALLEPSSGEPCAVTEAGEPPSPKADQEER